MKKFGLLLILGLVVLSCNAPHGHDSDTTHDTKMVATTDSVRDGMFIHITAGYDDPHRVLMPLKMASMMATDKDVLIYMDIHAVELLVKGAKDMEHKGFDSFQTYIKLLVEKNVGIYACPTCLQVAGFKTEDLMDGVQAAQKDKFFDFTKGRIITLDY
jgi:predicted peroxiredoxin